MLLPREQCKATRNGLTCRFDLQPIQRGLCGDAWRVAVASMYIRRGRSHQQAATIQQMLHRWPVPEAMAGAQGLQDVLRSPTRNRCDSRIQRFCNRWLCDNWEDMRELPGVCTYVADAVAIFCFGSMEATSSDKILQGYIASQRPDPADFAFWPVGGLGAIGSDPASV
jgi:adenine-specific DNA glycosylase